VRLTIIFLLSLFLLLPLYAQETENIVEFKIMDYDPTTREFKLKPTKPVFFSFKFVRKEDDFSNFPMMLAKIGKKVKCSLWKLQAGKGDSPLTGRTKRAYIMITCREEDFYMTTPVFSVRIKKVRKQ